MRRERLYLALYWGVVGLFALVLGWWVFFFLSQGEILVERIAEAGVVLQPDEVEAVREASQKSLRMLLFEGGFLGLMMLAGVLLVLRAMRREVALHHQQRDLVAAVSHELRSPIASAKLYLESMILGRVPEGKQERYLQNAKQDVDRLGAMVDRLLESARMSGGRPDFRFQRMDLAEYVRHAVERLAKAEGAGTLEAAVDAPGPVMVDADGAALETILRNLIANTMKYGGEDPRLTVRVYEADELAVLEVRDYGPGIQGIDTKHVFKPFMRGGDDKVRSRPGIGLGLYLVAELTRGLGGKVRALNAPDGDGGLAIRIALPRLEAEAGA